MHSVADILSATYNVHAINFFGHGDLSDNEQDFTIENFAEQVRVYAEDIGSPVHVFGYSMGGYVALYAAKKYPHLFDKIITLGTKLYWNRDIAVKEQSMLNPEMLLKKAPAFVQSLQNMHTNNDWQTVLSKTQLLIKKLGDTNLLLHSDVSTIQQPTLLMRGDRDKMVSFEETENVFRQLPHAELCVLPGTPHMIEKVNLPMLTFHMLRHLQN